MTARPYFSALYIPVFAITLFLSAALIFAVQPLFSKMILPLLGGTPQVWNTAMLFFQVALLAGYAYAHGTSKYFSVTAQAIVHIALLCLFFLVLPFAVPETWAPPTDRDPTVWQLLLMTLTVGGPFFVLAASAPMFQRWFAGSGHKDADNPYFLYGASNLGSMGALLLYPIAVEPLLALQDQTAIWTAGYGLLIVFTIFCAALTAQGKSRSSDIVAENASEALTWKRRLLWLALAFVPSSMMLGVTTHITTDIASVPLLWIMPLALYVATFIIVFARRELISYSTAANVQGWLVAALLGLQAADQGWFITNPVALTVFHMALFFVCALTCHMDLARSRPRPQHLTEFYMMMALGGALGGFFNAILAPQFLIIPIEYNLAILAALALRYVGDPVQSLVKTWQDVRMFAAKRKFDALFSRSLLLLFATAFFAAMAAQKYASSVSLVCGIILFLIVASARKKRFLLLGLCTLGFVLNPVGRSVWLTHNSDVELQTRSFFGVLRVVYNSHINARALIHGTTNHGVQSFERGFEKMPLSYYSPRSPLYEVFQILKTVPMPQTIGAIGLGVGSIACYTRQGRSFDFFEIDPDVVKIAENPEYFTFLSSCKSPYRVILGDGRLSIQKQPDHSYDVILVDAFSSDNIPVHLMTTEAITIYLSKLKPGGILLFHISNSFLSLEPVLAAAGADLQIPAYGRMMGGAKIKNTRISAFPSHYVALTKNQSYIKSLEDSGWHQAATSKGVHAWRDDFSNILSVLGSPTKIQRPNNNLKHPSNIKPAP